MPSKVTVFGNLGNLTGGALPAGTITLELSNIGTGNAITVTGTSVIPQLKYVIYSAADGSFTSQVWGNDVLNPSNTIYNVTFRDSYGNEVGPIQYSFTGSSVNLDSAAPINNVLPPIFAANVSVLTLLNQQGPLPAVTGTSSDATLYTYSLAANVLGAGQGLRITAFWSHGTGTASVTYKMKIGVTTVFSTSIIDTSGNSNMVLEIFNNSNVQTAQSWSVSGTFSGSPDLAYVNSGTSSINFLAANTINFTFAVASSDTVTPKFWLIEIINGPPNATPLRLSVSGPTLSSSDFSLSGWGSGASISSIRGCDSANEFLITAGTTPSVGPTVTLTFRGGAWPNEPITIAEIVGGTGQMATNEIDGNSTSFTLTYLGFPVAGATYLYRTVTVGI